jgi:hypothetical protein
MTVSCKACDEKGRIVSREELSLEFARLYCQCGSTACGHTWVTNLKFSRAHSIRLLKRLIAYCSTDYELYHAKNNMIYLSNLGLYHSGESTPLATNFIYSVGTNLSTT